MSQISGGKVLAAADESNCGRKAFEHVVEEKELEEITEKIRKR